MVHNFPVTSLSSLAKTTVFNTVYCKPPLPSIQWDGVQTVKKVLKKAVLDKRDPYLALLEYRNTPVYDTLARQHRDSWPKHCSQPPTNHCNLGQFLCKKEQQKLNTKNLLKN